MFNEKKYVERCGVFAVHVFEDLNRPTDEGLAALRRRAGFTDDDFYGTGDPARRALAELLRAVRTAREAKAEAGGR